MKARAAFMGTPAFAVPCLEALLEVCDVPLVVTQPDKPQGRGLSTLAPPVKALAVERGLHVIQPEKARDGTLREALKHAQVEFALVVAYGKILPADVLTVPTLGCVNVHASLLPRHRGAAPIQWAIVQGDVQTGVCLMQMDVGMDTGPVLARRVVTIGADETGGELFARLAAMSGELVKHAVPQFLRGELSPEPQSEHGASHARMIKKEDGALDFTLPAHSVHNQARGFYPWPGAYTALEGRRMKVHRTELVHSEGNLAEPGTVLACDAEGILVACGTGAVRIVALQLEGKKPMNVPSFLAGHTVAKGTRFARREELLKGQA